MSRRPLGNVCREMRSALPDVVLTNVISLVLYSQVCPVGCLGNTYDMSAMWFGWMGSVSWGYRELMVQAMFGRLMKEPRKEQTRKVALQRRCRPAFLVAKLWAEQRVCVWWDGDEVWHMGHVVELRVGAQGRRRAAVRFDEKVGEDAKGVAKVYWSDLRFDEVYAV